MRFAKTLTILALSIFSAVAAAGTKTNVATQVTTGFASGSFSSARYSANGAEFISCDLYSSGYINCAARDANWNYGWCYTYTSSNPLYATMLAGANSASNLFLWWDTSTNQCTSIMIRNGSNYLP